MSGLPGAQIQAYGAGVLFVERLCHLKELGGDVRGHLRGSLKLDVAWVAEALRKSRI